MSTLNINEQQLAQAFSQAADTYDAHALLQHEVGNRLLSRLDYIKITPDTILDLGMSTGFTTHKLQQRFTNATLHGMDLAYEMLAKSKQTYPTIKTVCANANKLPYADNSIDLIFSNLMLQWCSELKPVLSEIQRVLKPQGLFLFSTLGPDTLQELRASWQSVDDYTHINPFADMHDIGDALAHTQLSDPVTDMETITMTYDDVMTLMRDLKAIGAHNVNQQRPPYLTGKAKLQAMCQHYETFRNQQGLLPATYEIIYGHAWGCELTASSSMNQGEAIIPLHRLRASLRS